MNSKQIACVVVLLILLGMLQGTMWMNARMTRMQGEAAAAEQKSNLASIQLMTEKRQFDTLQASSKGLIGYLETWKPFFDEVDSSQNAELKISMRIKQDSLVSLSQKYEVATQANKALPSLMRARVSFDDNYARLLNWLGRLEGQLPTMRIFSLHITKGTGPDDLKIDAVLEQPLMAK